MYKYIVHVAFPKYVGFRDHYVEQQDRNITVALSSTRITCDDFHGDDWMDRDTFMFNKEEHALAFAEALAQEHPSADIYIAQTTAIVTAEIAKPIVKKVTDKGVLPV